MLQKLVEVCANFNCIFIDNGAAKLEKSNRSIIRVYFLQRKI